MKRQQVTFSKERPEQSLGFVFWQVSNLWQRKISEALKPLALTHVQFVLLAGIGWFNKMNASVTQVMLAQHAKTDIMMTSKVVRTLEAKKLIVREIHPHDPRAKSLVLTQAGSRLLMQALMVVEQVDEQFFSVLDNQIGSFLKGLNLLVDVSRFEETRK